MEQKRKITDNLPFLLVGVIAVIWHLTIKVSFGDDLNYFATLTDGRSIWEILSHRYQTWSSRLAIEFVLIPIVNHVFLWKIADVLVFTSIPVLLCRILDMDLRQRWVTAILVLLYPFSDMVSAGWISTTTNYLWPLWCLIFIGSLVKKVICGRKICWCEAMMGFLACIYGSSQEQVAVLLMVILVLAVFLLWKEQNRKCLLLYLFIAVNLCSFASILLCPGNRIRNMQEISGRMPEFAEFTFWEKLYMGLVNVERIFIANVNGVFLTTAAVLVALVYLKTKSYGKTLFSGLPIMILTGQSVVKLGYPRFEKIFLVPEQAVHWNWSSVSSYLPLLFLGASAAGILYALYELMKEDLGRYLCMVLLLGAGLASGVVMGFSPTIYASAERPYIYLYFILIFSCLTAVRRIEHTTWDSIQESGRRLLITLPALLAFLNIADVWWVCFLMRKL